MRTSVGYAGGTTPRPTYQAIGDHSESIRIAFDPERISYEQLLEVFWANHNPCSRSFSTQYKAAIFVHDAKQREVAEASKQRIAQQRGAAVHTEILAAGPYTLAEGYHQKYMMIRCKRARRELETIYPRVEDFVRSTAAARINGYLGGYGELAQLKEELAQLGLSQVAQQELLKKAGEYRR